MVEELLGTETIFSNRGKINPIEATSQAKVVGLLFIHNGCPFTADFTACLKSTYNKVNTENKVLEIIFCDSTGPCDLEED